MKKAAILIDGGFVLPKLQRQLGKLPAAQDLRDFAVACLDQAEELFRIYYYDCPPFEGVKQNPCRRRASIFRPPRSAVTARPFSIVWRARTTSRCAKASCRSMAG